MIRIYTNVVTKRNYDEDGNILGSGFPRMFFKTTEQVVWQLCSDTPDVDGTDITPEDWPKYTGYAGFSAVSAYLTADSDYRLKLAGRLVTAVSAGSVASLTADFSEGNYATIPSAGVITLFAPNGDGEVVTYTDRAFDGNGHLVFTLESGTVLERGYAADADMDVNESYYMQASLDTVASETDTGKFVFEITAYSEKLRRAIVYSNVRELSISGLELAIFNVGQDAVTVLERYVVETFGIRSGIADVDAGIQPTETQQSEIATLVNTILSSGFALQFSANGTSWHDTQDSSTDKYYRFRSSLAGGQWSDAIALPAGAAGATPVFTIGTVTTLPAGSSATVTMGGSALAPVLNFGLPAGSNGTNGTGQDGVTPQFTIGAVETLAPGAMATVTLTGSAAHPVLSFGLPRGTSGPQGSDGITPQLSVGNVTTLPAGSNATVTITGSATAPVLNFGIPRGSDGTGGGSAYVLPTASSSTLGGIKIGSGMTIDANGIASVLKATAVASGGTNPVTAGAVWTQMGGYRIEVASSVPLAPEIGTIYFITGTGTGV